MLFSHEFKCLRNILALKMQKKMQYKSFTNGPRREKNCLRGGGGGGGGRVANNTGEDQPAYLRILISAFIIRVLESTISRVRVFTGSGLITGSVRIGSDRARNWPIPLLN